MLQTDISSIGITFPPLTGFTFAKIAVEWHFDQVASDMKVSTKKKSIIECNYTEANEHIDIPVLSGCLRRQNKECEQR